MVALLGRLVGRRVPASAAGPPGVTQAGVGGLAPLPGRAQALPQRLDVLPAGARGPRCPAVCRRGPAPPPPPLPPPRWAPGWAACAGSALGDGAPLEARRQKTPVWRALGPTCSHRPRWPRAPAEAAAPDQRGAADRLAARPLGGRGGGALGCCRWLGCADVPDPPPGLVTRLRPQSASRPGQGRRPGPAARDERLPVGPSRAPPCPPPRRLGSVRWPGGWARALRPVLDPPRGSARQVGERDRRRRRLAEAWALTNRLWEVASWWTGATKAVPVQSDATVMVSPVLLPLCPQVAQVVGEPVARLAVARVWRALSPSRRAVERGDGDDVGAVRAGHAPRLGLIKRWRQHHRERQHLESIIGGDPEVETGGLMPTKTPRGQELTLAQALANQALHARRRRIEPGHRRVKRCRMVKDRIRLGKDGSRDVVMARCGALHHFRVRLTPWQPMVESG